AIEAMHCPQCDDATDTHCVDCGDTWEICKCPLGDINNLMCLTCATAWRVTCDEYNAALFQSIMESQDEEEEDKEGFDFYAEVNKINEAEVATEEGTTVVVASGKKPPTTKCLCTANEASKCEFDSFCTEKKWSYAGTDTWAG